MRFAFLLAPLALALLIPTQASANSCNQYVPFATTSKELASTCKMVVYVVDGYTFYTNNFQTVDKDGVFGTYDAPFTRSQVELPVELHDWDEDATGDCIEHITTIQERYWRYELDVSGLPVGTELHTPGGAAVITAEGSCAEGEKPFLYCQEPIQDSCAFPVPDEDCETTVRHGGVTCDPQDETDDDGGGCDAGSGSAGLGLALGLLVWTRRRRAQV